MACCQTQRFMNNGDTSGLFYVLPNFTPGATYKIRLHWAGLGGGAQTLRYINVLVNGQPVLSTAPRNRGSELQQRSFSAKIEASHR